MKTQARIVVVGGFGMELIFQAPRRPTAGETVFGTGFEMFPSGKGFRQAIAAGRAEGKVVAVGRIGQDDFGDAILERLVAENVETRWLFRDPALGTAVSSPLLTEKGQEGQINIPRANQALSVDDISQATQVLANAGLVLMHLEIPWEVSQAAAVLGRGGGAKIILTLAPHHGQEIPDDILQGVDILVVSESVIAEVAGYAPNESTVEAAAQALRVRGARRIVVTRGGEGCMLVERQGTQKFPGFKVRAVDCTGAGDAFSGALAVAIAERQPLAAALRFANAAGALACMAPGNLPALPTRHAIEQFMRK